MKKRERELRKKAIQEQQATHRKHNKEFPAAAGAAKALHAAQRFERIAKREGIAVARAERRKLRNLQYKERRKTRKNIFKRIATWLKPPKPVKVAEEAK